MDFIKLFIISLVLSLLGPATSAAHSGSVPTCSNAAIHPSPDYAYGIGSANFNDPAGNPESGSLFDWLKNGQEPITTPQAVNEGLLLHFDSSATGVNGETPSQSQGLAYSIGKWGQALALSSTGTLRYLRLNNYDPGEGLIELWVALQADGSEPVYSNQSHTLFQYYVDPDNWIGIMQSDTGIIHAGGVVAGQWESAYGSSGDMRSWKAGQWHHLAFTYSTSSNFMRFYVDGSLAADTNEGHYWAPPATGSEIAIGEPASGQSASYLIDELRISSRLIDAGEIAAHAHRLDQPRPNEVWLPTKTLSVGDSLTFEFTPTTAMGSGATCQSAPWTYPGQPITDPQPPSTLLAPGSSSVTLSVSTNIDTNCAYALDSALPYVQMTPFSQGNGARFHQTTIKSLDTNPIVVNQVYVRCASHPDYVLSLQYRVRANVNSSFPRTGNLWGWWQLSDKGLPYMAHIDLWLGADPAGSQVIALRKLNPDVLILTSINAVENSGLPDDYYLKDVNGHKIEVWPGAYRLNLTKNTVAEYQAHFAYQHMLDSGLMYDGVFFDNVMTTQSWLTHDIYGNPVQIDANEDGLPDDPSTLDAAWKAGVFHEMQLFRQLMPDAVISSHATDIHEPGISEIFNGNSLGFLTADVLEGEQSFSDAWAQYNDWMAQAKSPPVTMIEASPPDQIAYGYGYSPLDNIPPSTLEFARTLYPYMRFGLTLALMNDGYFAYEFGDTWHGNDWWYDELNYDLGQPLGPARRVDLGFDTGPNRIENGGFESPITYPWNFWADTGNVASFTRDTSTAVEGNASARIDIASTAGTDWRIEFSQDNRSLIKGTTYDLTFFAKSDITRLITVSSQKNAPEWDNYGLWKQFTLGPTWQQYTITFESTTTASDARIQFLVGAVAGTVWLDDVHLTLHPPDVYQRQYTNGLVLLNGTSSAQTISLGAGYRRLVGSQAPRFEKLLDDTGPGFITPLGSWATLTFDSGEWQASGPYFHNWGVGVHKSDGSAPAQARWSLQVPATDVYSLTAWWPAAPEASTWNQSAVYEIVAGGKVVASTTLNQTTGGDEWHAIGSALLSPTDNAYVQLTCQDAPCIADALYLRSNSRYNDGSPARSVTLQPLDGIILQRDLNTYTPMYLPAIMR